MIVAVEPFVFLTHGARRSLAGNRLAVKVRGEIPISIATHSGTSNVDEFAEFGAAKSPFAKRPTDLAIASIAKWKLINLNLSIRGQLKKGSHAMSSNLTPLPHLRGFANFLIVALLAWLPCQAVAQNIGDDPNQLDRQAVIKSAVAKLLEIQNEDGAWPYEGVYRVNRKIPVGYRIGGTAICCEALLYATASDHTAANQAIRRGTRLILQELQHPLMKPSQQNRYDVRVWGHIYALDLFCRLRATRRFPSLMADIESQIPILTKALLFEELDEGGWNYASRRAHAGFVTAPAVQALLWAKQCGQEIPVAVFARASEALTRSRNQAAAFAYSGNERANRPTAMPGAIARAANCEATFHLLGQPREPEIEYALNAFYQHWDELEKRRKQHGTHVPPYGIAPYYFYYGHRYAALAINTLPIEKRAVEHQRLYQTILKTRDPDGTWNDRVFDRSKAYGTAMSLLALLQDKVPLPNRLPTSGNTKTAGDTEPATKRHVEWGSAATPASQGMNAQRLIELHRQIAAGKYGYVDKMLVIRNGRTVFDETYFRDYDKLNSNSEPPGQYNYNDPAWHPFYRDTELHTLQSVTKSITALAIGIAIDRGEISGVDVKVVDLFPDLKIQNNDERKRAMSLEDLLTMRSGIEWNESLPYADPNNTCIQLEASPDWFQFVIHRRLDTDPGKVFEYNSGASLLLSAVIQQQTGQSIDQYLERHLFTPLGIAKYYWKKTPTGLPDTEGGLYLRPLDLAKIGQLCLDKGKWQGKQVVSADWIEKMLQPHVADVAPRSNQNNNGYGYQWWLLRSPTNSDEVAYACLGFGGQYLIVSPKHDMIAVFNGWNIFDKRPLPLSVFWKSIIPSVEPSRSSTGGQTADQAPR